jgi:hypothetical protein
VAQPAYFGLGSDPGLPAQRPSGSIRLGKESRPGGKETGPAGMEDKAAHSGANSPAEGAQRGAGTACWRGDPEKPSQPSRDAGSRPSRVAAAAQRGVSPGLG